MPVPPGGTHSDHSSATVGAIGAQAPGYTPGTLVTPGEFSSAPPVCPPIFGGFGFDLHHCGALFSSSATRHLHRDRRCTPDLQALQHSRQHLPLSHLHWDQRCTLTSSRSSTAFITFPLSHLHKDRRCTLTCRHCSRGLSTSAPSHQHQDRQWYTSGCRHRGQRHPRLQAAAPEAHHGRALLEHGSVAHAGQLLPQQVHAQRPAGAPPGIPGGNVHRGSSHWGMGGHWCMTRPGSRGRCQLGF